MRLSRRHLLATAALAAPALHIRPVYAADFRWKWATNQPVTHPSNIRGQEAIDRIREESKGRMEITLFPNNQLGGDTDMLSQLRAGAIHIFLVSGLIAATVVPAGSANGVGFAFKDYDAVWAAMDGDFGAHIRQKMEQEAGLHAFPKIWDNGFRQVTSSRGPVRTPDDLRGFKIRVPVMPIATSLFESLGAAPTGINVKEAYSAMQTKLVDGQENPLSIIENWKFYEVQKYCSLTNHMWDGFWALSNAKAYQRLPADLQEILTRNVTISGDAQRADLRRLNEGLQGDIEKQGMVFNAPDLPSFRAKLRDAGFYRKWQESFGPELWALLEQTTGKLA